MTTPNPTPGDELAERLRYLHEQASEPEPADLVTVDTAARPLCSSNTNIWRDYYTRISSARQSIATLVPEILESLRTRDEAARSSSKVERLRAALAVADEALCDYACHAVGAPCIRSVDQCASECGKQAGDALLVVRAALEAKDHSNGK